MSKRFTETTKWSDPWFMNLSPVAKLLWFYLLDHCDNSGVIDLNSKLAAFQIGEAIDAKHFVELGERLQTLPNGRLWIAKFIEFQYGKLGTESRPHLQVLSLIKTHGLDVRLSKAFVKASDGPKDPDKDKDKDKDKEGGVGETTAITPSHDAENTGVAHFPEVSSPSRAEFLAYCSGLGMPEWYALDKFFAASQQNWTKAPNWRAYATRVFNWWVERGRPKHPEANGAVATVTPTGLGFQLKAVQARIDEHVANPRSRAFDRFHTPELKVEFKNLKEREKELQIKLSGVSK